MYWRGGVVASQGRDGHLIYNPSEQCHAVIIVHIVRINCIVLKLPLNTSH